MVCSRFFALLSLADVWAVGGHASPAGIVLAMDSPNLLWTKGLLAPVSVQALDPAIQALDPAIDEIQSPDLGLSHAGGAAFFACGFLCGIIATVLVVGALSDRIPGPSIGQAALEKEGRFATRDPEPEPGAGLEASTSDLHADAWLRGPRPAADDVPDDLQHFWPRCGCLAVLLCVQSGSSIILGSFRSLIEHHTELVFFFTMLVGLGGNAGVQSVVLAVRRFAKHEEVTVSEQFHMGLKLAAVLAPLAFLRALLQGTSMSVCVTIGVAAVFITVLATSLGTSLALLLQKFHVDPAHASPTIQVVMDMAGLLIACTMGLLIIDVMWVAEHV